MSLQLYAWSAVLAAGRARRELFTHLPGSGLLVGKRLFRIEDVRKQDGNRYLLLTGGRLENVLSTRIRSARVLPSATFEAYYRKLISSLDYKRTLAEQERAIADETRRIAEEEQKSAEEARRRATLKLLDAIQKRRGGVAPASAESVGRSSPAAAPRTVRSTAGVTMGASTQREDWRAFEQVLAQCNVQYLWHFTDVANLDSIREHGGLYSWYTCEKKGILIPKPGGDMLSRALDSRRGLGDYVRLSFNANPPMLARAQAEGRIGEVEIIRVDRRVIYWKGTLFSHLNATDAEAHVGGDLVALRRIDLAVATSRSWDGDEQLRQRQAEVLVPKHIPLSLLSLNHG